MARIDPTSVMFNLNPSFRYQDEIQSLNSTLDLSATIPATPRVGEQADPNNNYPGMSVSNLFLKVECFDSPSDCCLRLITFMKIGKLISVESVNSLPIVNYGMVRRKWCRFFYFSTERLIIIPSNHDD